MTKRMRTDTKDIVNRYVLVIDTETTGLAYARNVTEKTYEKWDKARLVQIAWELYNPSKECIERECHIIIPDNFEIPEVVVKIHGINTERALNEGKPLIDIIKKLHIILNKNPVIVAHNIQFDNDIILAELYRYQNKLKTNLIPHTLIDKVQIDDIIDLWTNTDKHCTMLMGTIPGERWPKLINLYEKCFGSKPDYEMHHADNDVRACADIYFHLLVKEINGSE